MITIEFNKQDLANLVDDFLKTGDERELTQYLISKRLMIQKNFSLSVGLTLLEQLDLFPQIRYQFDRIEGKRERED